jgi:DNA-binding beta-propeller fold protein YncE
VRQGQLGLPVAIESGSQFGFKGPTSIAVAGGRLWVTNSTGQSITEFGGTALPQSLSGSAAYAFTGTPAMVSGRNHLWIANRAGNSITELNVTSAHPVRTLTGSALQGVNSLALFGTMLWVATANSIVGYDTRSGGLIVTDTYGIDRPAALAVSNGRLWVANAGDNSVTELDASTGAVLHNAQTGLNLSGPVSAAAGKATLWVASADSQAIAAISTQTGQVQQIIAGTPGHRLARPYAVALAGGALWVVSRRDNSVTEINTFTGSIMTVLQGKSYGFSQPTGLVAFDGRLWVTNPVSNTVTSIVVVPVQSSRAKGRLVAAGRAGLPTRQAPGARR